jgi:hypothetical protein
MKDLSAYSTEELTAELERRWRATLPPTIYYFGVWPGHSTGHFIWDRHWNQARDAERKLFAAAVASGLSQYPWDAKIDNRGNQPQGLFFYKKGEGISLISCWDRSGDGRYNSCSSFISPNVLSREELLFWARETYPEVFSRMEKAGISIGWAE